MFPWRSVIRIKRTADKPVYLQVANSIIEEIHSGRLAPGQKLPGTRKLGALLKLNRNTVVAAINELCSQGWIESSMHKGTFVSAKLPQVEYKALPAKELPDGKKSAIRINDLPSLEPLYLDGSGKILIDDGVPDVRLAPILQLFRHQRSILSRKVYSTLLKYNHVAGDLDLRTTLTSYLRDTRGLTTTPDNIFITRGSQMSIYLSMAALLKPGDVCITSFPGYPIVDTMAKYLNGQVEHVSVDSEGLVTNDVEKICKRKKIKLLYATTHHHYPTTVTLSPVRRIELLRLALKYNFFILEDDYAYDFQYDNNPVLPLASLNKNSHVIYIGSFSKCLSPTVRVGYLVAPTNVINAANKLRRVIDRQGDPLLERALSEFIKSGDLQRHLKKVVRVYKFRRDYFCSLLTKHLSDHLTFSKPDGGMTVWITFKRRTATKGIADKLSNSGYLLDSDSLFLEKLNSARIGFAAFNEEEMEHFVAALKKALIER